MKALVNRARILFRYWRPWGYNASNYWRDRHATYQLSLKGVGEKGLTEAENQAVYEQAAATYRKLCRDLGIDFRTARVLDIGCGNGFYANILAERGVTDYTGVDITDVLFDELTSRFPGFRFIERDITAEPVDGPFDLVQMIDVTQHIVNDEAFARAMHHVREAVAENGVVVVTSWLDAGARTSYYEKSRDLSAYTSAFDGFTFTEPVPFRDKFIFSMRR